MKIWILRDGRPGHFHQSEGVVTALRRRRPVAVARLDLAVPRRLRGRALRGLVRLLGLSPRLAMRAVHGFDIDGRERPELIVSAGGDTLAANALLARHFGAANIFIGSLREVPETAFRAVLTIYPSLAGRPRHILTLKPPPFDPDELPAPRRIGSADDLKGTHAALLVGGPSGSHDWSGQDWDALLVAICAMSDNFDMDWTITTSRRTPDTVCERLKAFARLYPRVRRFVDGRREGQPPVAELFAADVLFVTEDSATMMMEGVASRRPVVVLVPKRRRASRDDEAVDGLERDRRLVRVPLAGATWEALAGAVCTTEPLADNPLDGLADALDRALDLPAGERSD